MNNLIKSAVFDLDGTLMQSHGSIYKATIKTLEEFNIDVNFTEQEFNGKIGAHFKDIFAEFQVAVDDLEYFIERYKSFYFDFIDDSKFYPDVFDVLKKLNENKIAVSILTTKSQDQVDKIVDHFDIRHYFKITMGRRPGIKIKPAPDMLIKICNDLSIKPENTLMIGDSELDVLCGKSAGAKTCAVTYGYRNAEALKKENPDYLISDISELIKILNL
jgi:phosphoglycolate phosphatase/pyrophosphatase PpaX